MKWVEKKIKSNRSLIPRYRRSAVIPIRACSLSTGTKIKMADEEEDDEVCDSWEDMADSGVRSQPERTPLIYKHTSNIHWDLWSHK